MIKKVIVAFFIVLISIFIFWNTGTNKENKAICHIVLSYHKDFGSYSINQSKLMGRGIWQWLNHNENPNTFFDIKVIVYGPTETLSDLKLQYKTSKEREKDYRFINVLDIEKFIKVEEEEYSEALTSCKKDPIPSCSQFNYISKLKTSLEPLKSNNCTSNKNN